MTEDINVYKEKINKDLMKLLYSFKERGLSNDKNTLIFISESINNLLDKWKNEGYNGENCLISVLPRLISGIFDVCGDIKLGKRIISYIFTEDEYDEYL